MVFCGYTRNRIRTRPVHGFKLELIDVMRASVNADVTRDVYVQLPDEDSEDGMCGRLVKAVYGTRDAAQHFENEYMNFMTEMGFSPGMSTPCAFHK